MKPFSRLTKKLSKHLFLNKSGTLFQKYSLYFFYLVFVPILLIITLSIFYVLHVQQFQTELEATKMISSANHHISDTLSSMEMSAYAILGDEQVNIAIYSNDVAKDAASFKNVREKLSFSLKQYPYMRSIEIYSFNNNYLFGINVANYLENIPKNHLAWYEYYKKTGITDFYIPVKSSGTSELCMVRSLSSNEKTDAFVIFYIDTDLLFSFKEDAGYIMISNIDDTILYATNHTFEGYKANEINEPFSKFYYNNKDMKISYNHSYAKTVLPYSNITLIFSSENSGKFLLYRFIFICVIIVLITLILATYFSRYLTEVFYSHIAKTIAYLTSESGSSYDNTQDEISWIKNSIKDILNSNRELELQLSKSIINLKNSHMAAMQLQCNPHFLFNALNLASMHAICEIGENSTTSEIISLVSDLLRTALDTKSYFVTIGKEFEFAQKYIRIEALKYNNNFDVDYDVDTTVLSLKTVKLTMQPLIENAFKHGIHKLPKSKRGKITISIKPVNNTVVFKIYDNGYADSEYLDSLTEMLNNDIYTIVEKNIGLKNVNSRIKILLGAKFGCKIYRENDMTVSEIIIPKNPQRN